MKKPQAELDLDGLAEAWVAIAAAFAFYGKQIRAPKGLRQAHLNRLLAEGYTGAELACAVHGYVRFHEGLHARPGRDGFAFDPSKWFDPDSVFRLDRLERRIELGELGPFKSKQSLARERAEAAEADRQRYIAQVKEERRLRLVQPVAELVGG